MMRKWSRTLWPDGVFVLCILHYINSIIMQTYLKLLNFWNACQVYSIKSMTMIKPILSIIFRALYGLCVCSVPISHDCENMCTWSYYHHQIGSMNHLPLFRVWIWKKWYVLDVLLCPYCIKLIGMLLIGPWATNYDWIKLDIKKLFLQKKCKHLKISSTDYQSFFGPKCVL